MSVRRSVGRSVGPVGLTHLFFRRFSGSLCIPAPAQSHATDSAVYTALFYKIPVYKIASLDFFEKLRTNQEQAQAGFRVTLIK